MLVVKSQMRLFTCLVQQSCCQPVSHLHRTSHASAICTCLWWGVAFLPCPCPCGQHLRANRRQQRGYKKGSGAPIRDHVGLSLPKGGKEEVMWEESEAPCTHLLPAAVMNLSAQLRHHFLLSRCAYESKTIT